MGAGSAIPPGCPPEALERTVLEQVIELLPVRMTVAELCSWIATNPEDDREVEAIREAIRDLKRSGLLRYRNDDQVVEPTQAGAHAFTVLTL